MSFAAAMVMAEARRRRDSRGRYMENGSSQSEMSMGYAANEQENEMRQGGNRNEMAYNEGGSGGEMRRGGNRNEMAYNEGGSGGQMRRGGNRNEMAYNEGGSGGEMRRGRNRNEIAYNEGGSQGEMRRAENRNEMGGEGYFVWDRNYPVPYLTPERYGQPGMNYAEDNNVVDMRTYDRRRNNMNPTSHMQDKENRQQMMHGGKIGFGEQEQEKHLTREKAEKWIRSMKTPDGKPLQHVPMSEIQRIAPNYGVSGEKDMLEMWVVVNMMKSDYQDIGKKYAGDSVDFYAGLAKDWLEDKDAVEDKLHMYKKYIVEDDD